MRGRRIVSDDRCQRAPLKCPESEGRYRSTAARVASLASCSSSRCARFAQLARSLRGSSPERGLIEAIEAAATRFHNFAADTTDPDGPEEDPFD